MEGFDHILNWKLKAGSHPFPGKDGGTCINEAALVAAGFPYRPVRSVLDMPSCFSRPICGLAMMLNDEASDADRQRLMPFVTRLACADTPDVERRRAAYIDMQVNLSAFHPRQIRFERGLMALEGALAIGRKAEAIGFDEVRDRMVAVRGQPTKPNQTEAATFSAKLKSWFGQSETESVE